MASFSAGSSKVRIVLGKVIPEREVHQFLMKWNTLHLPKGVEDSVTLACMDLRKRREVLQSFVEDLKGVLLR
jgi:hypothetical protein